MEIENPTIPDPLPENCRCCQAPVSPEDQFCPACGFPLQASKEEQDKYIYARGYQKLELDSHSSRVSSAAKTFYILAAIIFVIGVVNFFGHADAEQAVAILVTNAVLALLFLLLGFWSRKKPIAAIISGLVLYILIQVINMIDDPISILQGIIFKILIIGYLVKGLVSALAAEKIRKQNSLD